MESEGEDEDRAPKRQGKPKKCRPSLGGIAGGLFGRPSVGSVIGGAAGAAAACR